MPIPNEPEDFAAAPPALPAKASSEVMMPSASNQRWWARFDWLKVVPIILSVVAIVLSTRSLSVSKSSYQLAEGAHLENIAPRIAVLNLSLSEAPHGFKDLAVIGFQVQNLGSLPLSDVHIYFNYRNENPIDAPSQPAMWVGINNEGSGPGAALVPGDRIDKSELLFNVDNNRPTSVHKLKTSQQGLELNIRTDFTNRNGTRGATCSAFFYAAYASRFERRADCMAYDITQSFRSPPSPNGVLLPSTKP